MEIQFCSHASILLKTSDGSLLQDPWFQGKAFNDGWALLSPPFIPEWKTIDRIWISHEHPDHMNFPTLKSIPAEDRGRIEVLYQRHASGRIAGVLAKMGFKNVRELPLGKWTVLPSGTRLYCGSVGSMDSFLAVQDKGRTVLNLNDCVLTPGLARALAKTIGATDFLFTQFSFANWVGNEQDETGAAESKRREVVRQNEIFKPRQLVPFASFIYFCNAENARMNAWANLPGTIAGLGLENVRFMYPGDQVSAAADIPLTASQAAIAAYAKDWEKKVIAPTPASVKRADLEAAVKLRLKEYGQTKYVSKTPPLEILVPDLDSVLNVDFKSGTLAWRSVDGGTPRFTMISQVADYFFRHPWGPSTIFVSGMYRDREFAKSGSHPFIRYQNWLSTEVFDFRNLKSISRTAHFLWKKRAEIYHRIVKY